MKLFVILYFHFLWQQVPRYREDNTNTPLKGMTSRANCNHNNGLTKGKQQAATTVYKYPRKETNTRFGQLDDALVREKGFYKF
jgi:hypothetical protein